jgi:hypothetical protein
MSSTSASEERITAINANTGTGMDQLEVVNSEDQRLIGGRPSSGGRNSSWSADPQEVLLAIQGRTKTVREEDP